MEIELMNAVAHNGGEATSKKSRQRMEEEGVQGSSSFRLA